MKIKLTHRKIDLKRKTESERLSLRKWQERDIDDLIEGMNNFNIAKNLITPFPYTKADAVSFLNRIHDIEKENKYYFAVILKASGEVVGGTNVNINAENETSNGGVWIKEKHQGNGYGKELFILRARFCFENFNLDKINNGFLEGNEISWNIQKKIGYKIVGETFKFCPARGQETKDTITELTKENFYRAIDGNS